MPFFLKKKKSCTFGKMPPWKLLMRVLMEHVCRLSMEAPLGRRTPESIKRAEIFNGYEPDEIIGYNFIPQRARCTRLRHGTFKWAIVFLLHLDIILGIWLVTLRKNTLFSLLFSYALLMILSKWDSPCEQGARTKRNGLKLGTNRRRIAFVRRLVPLVTHSFSDN